ncbi:MAG: sulfatase-like hydrolase/transferase [Mariprofundaceae bacterium]|nr:sulfatase-like hydrolase/transferase [Mariprofundaceae bacterium]
MNITFKTSATFFLLRLMLVFYALFFVLRLALLCLYPDEFADLSLFEVFYAMLKGAWFIDSSISLVFLGIPFLLLYAIGHEGGQRVYLKVLSWYAFVLLLCFTVLLVGDLLYFGLVHRHAGHEVSAALQTSFAAVLEMLLSSYWLHFLVFLAVLVLAAKLWHMWMQQNIANMQYYSLGWWRLPLFIFVFLVVLLGMRGGISSKPIQPIFAYNEGSMAMGHLVLNGAFSVLHGLEKSTMRTLNFMPKKQAESMVKSMFLSPNETVVDAQYPLLRQRTEQGSVGVKQPNIVILLLESWDGAFLDVTRSLAGKKPYGITPNYNALVKKGRLYTQFYANGQRSIDGITSLIAGIPSAPGAGYLGEGIETNAMGWLGDIAKKQGYTTSFLRGATRASFYMDKIAPLAGFDVYYGSEDLLTKLHPDAPKSQWGGWDYDVLMTGHQLYSQAQLPFLSVMFTVSTHSPFTLPDEQWRKFTGNSEQEKYLNTIYYADWVLGQFFKAAKEADYYHNTIFILVGDHTSGHMAQPSLKEQHHLPLLLFGPGIEAGIDDTLGSQTDLIPTIMDMAGWSGSHASMGASLLEKRDQRSVMFTRDNMVGRIEKGGMLVYNLQRTVHFEGEASQQQAIEQRLKAQTQVLVDVLLYNQLYP